MSLKLKPQQLQNTGCVETKPQTQAYTFLQVGRRYCTLLCKLHFTQNKKNLPCKARTTF